MSTDTWIHRAVRRGVRPLVDTRVTPNQLTTLRLLTGLLAAAGFAAGTPGASAVAGTLFLVSALLDRADGELARLGGKTSPRGHAYDTVSDGAVTVLTFVGIGIGLRTGVLGGWTIIMGVVAGAAVGVMFVMAERFVGLGLGTDPVPAVAGFDPDDSLFLVPVMAWLDWLFPLLLAATLLAPTCALALYMRLRDHLPRRPAS